MKGSTKLIAIGFAIGLSGMTASAMSELASITVTPLWPTNSNPGCTLRYEVRVERNGSGLLEVDLTAAGLPEGCEATFGESTLRFTGNSPSVATTTLTVCGRQPTPLDCCAFTVTGSALRESLTFTNCPNEALRLGQAPLLMVSIIPQAGGRMEVRGSGATAGNYAIEAASDLFNPTWTPVGSCVGDGNGRFMFCHNGATAQAPSMRFYRAVSVGAAD
jgi:hypothetical protein